MPDTKSPLEQTLYDLIMLHLSRLEEYLPGPVKAVGGDKEKLIAKYRADPLFSIWGLDSTEYATATLGGGTITSIHRKLGDIYQESIRTVFIETLNQSAEETSYSAPIVSGTKDENRSADAYLQFDRLPKGARERVARWCRKELKKLAASPRVDLIGVGMEIRHCYQTGDSKRTQADEAMARHLLISGILPVMPLFCNQSNRTVIARYRSVWIVKEGIESYDMIKVFTGFDYFDFLMRNRDDLRAPVINMLRRLSA